MIVKEIIEIIELSLNVVNTDLGVFWEWYTFRN
jgi:hypothetical protein